MGAKPTFVAIGPGRCGTSWLFDMLKAHPDVTMAKVKETEFFNTNYHRGIGWYESHFPEAGGGAVGEISNNYYLDPEVAVRIREYESRMKLIVSVRNPYQLLESFYAFGVRRGRELPALNQALDRPIGPIMGSGYDERLRDNALTASDSVTLLDSVLLGARLAPFFRAFPASQIYVFIYERLAEEPRALLREIYEFIGVDPEFVPPKVEDVINATVVPRVRAMAQLASRAAFVLRSIGAYRVLNTMRDSPLVRGLLYRTPQRGPANSVSKIRQMLPDSASRMIDEDITGLASLHATLRQTPRRYADASGAR